jgi:two-component system, response regulator RegA
MESSGETGSPAMPSRRVLIVDDDEMCLGALQQILTRWGYRVVCCSSFADARAYLAAETPDVAIVDVRLGDYNGLQLLQMLKLASSQTLLAALSGYDDLVLREEAQQMGALYMTKPVDSSRLRQWLESAQSPDASPAL